MSSLSLKQDTGAYVFLSKDQLSGERAGAWPVFQMITRLLASGEGEETRGLTRELPIIDLLV